VFHLSDVLDFLRHGNDSLRVSICQNWLDQSLSDTDLFHAHQK